MGLELVSCSLEALGCVSLRHRTSAQTKKSKGSCVSFCRQSLTF